MLVDSGQLQDLEQYADVDSRPMCVFMVTLHILIVCIFRRHSGTIQEPSTDPLTAEMEALNQSLSKVRVTVEWLFRDIVSCFRFLDLKKKSEDWPEQC